MVGINHITEGDQVVALRKKNGHSQQELEKIYHISLDDLVENQVEIVVKEKKLMMIGCVLNIPEQKKIIL